MSNQRLAKVILCVGALLVLALGGCAQVSEPALTAGGPSFPTGVSASPGNGTVTLSWLPVDGATSYNVYWSTIAGVNKFNGTVISKITATTYPHTTVSNGVVYYYVVTAVNGGGESQESEQVSATPSAAWGTKASMSTARESMASGVVGGKIYVIGGFNPVNGSMNSTEVFNPATNSWSSVSPLNTAATARYLTAGSVIGTNIYVMGGLSSSSNSGLSTVEQYATTTNTWTAKASMPTARYGLTSSATSSLIYAFGGASGSTSVSTVEAYNPTTDSWTTKAPMPTARYQATSSIVGSVIYVIGGSAVNPTSLGTVEAYDTVSNSWSTKKPMPTPRRGMTSSVVNGKIYVMGGFNEIVGTVLNTVEVYDPATDSWTSAEAMPTARNVLTSGAVNGGIYAIGGFDGFDDLKTVELLTP